MMGPEEAVVDKKKRTFPSGDGTGAGSFPKEGIVRRALRFTILTGLPIAILAAGIAAAAFLIRTGPKADRKPSVRRARLVEVTAVDSAPRRITVDAMGEVLPARRIDLFPRVSGLTIETNPNLAPGGVFEEGERILALDPTDYELVVRELRSDVADAEAELRIEEGRRSIARREYELLEETIREEDRDLVLREPQREAVRARLEGARAALRRAELDQERTVIRAPFPALVLSHDVDLGSLATPSTRIATLADTGTFWVEASVPVDRLPWIRIPRTEGEPGATVRVYDEAAWGADLFREGRVVRLAGALEERGRMARVIVAVDDPLGLDDPTGETPRLLLNAYVRLEIEGERLERAVALARNHLREGDRVWVLADGKLEIRPVRVAHRGRDAMLVTDGLADGDRVITSEIPAPVEGMPLRTREDDR